MSQIIIIFIFGILVGYGSLAKEYIKVPLMDIYEHDIVQYSGKTVDELKTICESTSGCIGFNTHGWLKSSARNMRPDNDVDFYYFADVIEPIAATLPVHIWPMPKQMTNGTTKVYIDRPNFEFYAEKTNEDLADAINRYKNLIFYFTGSKPSSHPSITKVRITVNDFNSVLQMGYNESYELIVPLSGDITIKAETVYGAYHALETLSQMIVWNSLEGEYYIESCPYNIFDEPRYQHRSILVDTARHFLPLPVLFKVIDTMSYAKYNVFHWHLTDDDTFPIEVKKHPLLWEKGSYSRYERYSQDEMKVVVEYARKRGIRVIPEIDTPGHAAAMCGAYPDLCPSELCIHPMNPTTNFTFDVLNDIFTELTGGKNRSGLFYDDYFHLGGDEVQYFCWDNTQKIVEWMKSKGWTSYDVYKYLIDGVTQIAIEHGRVPIVWEDVFKAFTNKLDKRTIVEVWLRKELFLQALQAGYRAILSIEDPWYLDYTDFTWQQMYKIEPTQDIPAELHHLIMGGGPTMWSERVDTSVWFNTVWPKAAVPAEVLWTPKELLDIDKAMERLKWFRCHLNNRGVGAGPVINKSARQAPPNQDSCYLQ